MNAQTPITPEARQAARIDRALVENAKIEAAIGLLREYMSANIVSAARNNGWCNIELHGALMKLHEATTLDGLHDAAAQVADALLGDHNWDVETGNYRGRECAI